MSQKKFLAFDFGAESGRAIIGVLENEKLTLKEIHRFPTGMLKLQGHFHWNIFRLYEETKKAMKICVEQEQVQPDAIAIDTWGVDYALLAEDGSFLGLPHAYRDSRTDTAKQEFTDIIPSEQIYDLTGIQFMQFNTLFQLHAAVRDTMPQLKVATDLLFVPDIFNYLFTGVKKSEFSFATTSQLYNPKTNQWEEMLFKTLGISKDIMQDIVDPGTIIGELTDDICKETGMQKTPVVAVASHDTGSAIAAIPAEGSDWAYISSGTWSLMGIETKSPLISQETLKFNLTNEGGVEHTFRVLKNIMGLWLLQQCKKAWEKENYTYPRLIEMSQSAPAFKSFVNPDDTSFYNPENMPAAIDHFCDRTNQEKPASHGEYVRLIMESLALKYRYTLEQLREVSPHTIKKLYIIGGGTQNELLCQYTANACGIPVVTGSSEGTAVGNLMVQAMALGEVSSLDEIREVIRNSFESKIYEPQERNAWEEAYLNFKSVL
jgi:rhamnulokinase